MRYEIWESEWSRVPGQELVRRGHRLVEVVMSPDSLYTAIARRNWWTGQIPTRQREHITYAIVEVGR